MSDDDDDHHDDNRSGDGNAAVSGLVALTGAGRAHADAWLDEQTRLTRLQREREERDETLRAWSQFVGYASQLLKLAFEFVLAVVVIVIGVALVTALWNASHDNGLVIEAFSVPPDLANRGLSGEVVAGKLLDRLQDLQVQTQSNRAASSYVNNWGNDIKVQIPDTGVSVGQLYRYLAQWLGNETHISGEVYREADGRLAVLARVAGSPTRILRGNDAQLDALMQQSAESVYRSTQPYRYAVYLDNHGRAAEARAIYRELIANGAADDRAWAYIGLSSEHSVAADFDGANRLLLKAMAIKPDILLIYANLANNEGSLQHDEKALYFARAAVALAARGGRDSSMAAYGFQAADIQNRGAVAQATGDIAAARRINNEMFSHPDFNNSWTVARQASIGLCGQLHDRACFEQAMDAMPPAPNPLQDLNRLVNVQQAHLFFGDWREVVTLGDAVIPMLAKVPRLGPYFLAHAEYPIVAVADAELGDLKSADALVVGTPADCDVCMRIRGRIAMRARRWGAAEYWYAREARAAPSSSTAQSDWGEMLLAKGDYAGARARFARAVALGPRDFEAYERWGETLIRENRSDLALAKFALAARDAPNWGRLHLKWGEALLWSGDRAGAQAQFARAAALYLTPDEPRELARFQSSP
jgi:tetratricopeptide (TPR) repeat protein